MIITCDIWLVYIISNIVKYHWNIKIVSKWKHTYGN